MLTLDQLCRELKKSHELTQSWRATGEPYQLNPAMARMIANGYQPGKRVRKHLGLPPAVSVVVVMGEVPAGSQAISAQQCECGQWFVSNHPRRRRCFLCSPYRGRR